MDEPTLEQQANAMEYMLPSILSDAETPELRAALSAVLPTIRRHAELVRLCRAHISSNPITSTLAWDALVAAIGKEP